MTVHQLAVLWGIAVFVVCVSLFTLIVKSDDGSKAPPYGCTWVDMNTGKGSDWRLACVDGYGP